MMELQIPFPSFPSFPLTFLTPILNSKLFLPVSISLTTVACWVILVRSLRPLRRRTLKRHFAHLFDPSTGELLPNAAERIHPLDAQRLMWYTAWYETPFAFRKAHEFALFKTYGIPYVSSLLVQTGELCNTATAAKRGEDTGTIFCEFISCPLDSKRCKAGIARMNYLHRRYGKKIRDEDIVYTMASVVITMTTWIENYEVTPPTPLETLGLFVFWRTITLRMGVPPELIPSSYPALKEWFAAYGRTNMRYEESNRQLAEASIAFMLSYVHMHALKPVVRRAIIALLEDDVRQAMGFEEIPSYYPKIVKGLFSIRGFILRNFVLPRIRADIPPITLTPNEAGKYNRTIYSFEPYYIPRTFWTVLEGYVVTGLVPNEKYHCGGYDIARDLGPEMCRDKGGEEMRRDMEKMEDIDEVHTGVGVKRGLEEAGCPFRFRNEGIDSLK